MKTRTCLIIILMLCCVFVSVYGIFSHPREKGTVWDHPCGDESVWYGDEGDLDEGWYEGTGTYGFNGTWIAAKTWAKGKAKQEGELFLLTVSYSGFPAGKPDRSCTIRGQCIINDISIKSSLGKTYNIDEQFPVKLAIEHIPGVLYLAAPWDHFETDRIFNFNPKDGEIVTVVIDVTLSSSGIAPQHRILSYKLVPKVKDGLYCYEAELPPEMQ